MTHDSFDELAHAALDGTATPAQRSALDDRLATDSSVRERWLDIQAAYRALEQVPKVEPPLDLKPSIMRAVHAERRVAASAGASAGVRERVGRAFGLRLASAFAAGALVTVLVWPLVTGDRGGYGNLPASGMMMPGPGAATIDRLSLAAGTATLTIELVAIPHGVVARIEARAGADAELVLDHEATLAAESLREIEGQPLQVSITPGSVGLEFAGEMRCAVLLQGDDASKQPIRVTLRAGGMTSTGVLGQRPR